MGQVTCPIHETCLVALGFCNRGAWRSSNLDLDLDLDLVLDLKLSGTAAEQGCVMAAL